MNSSDLWLILRGRKRVFLGILGTVLLLTLIVSLVMPKTFTAQASLVIDTKSSDPVTGAPGPPADISATILATQFDIITSHNVALKVVDRLNLTADPTMVEKFQGATGGRGPIRDWVADTISRSVGASPSSKDSNVIVIAFSSHSAEMAAQMANAYADAYIQTSLELREDPARRQSIWFDQQIDVLRKRVDLAQQKLLDAQRKSSIVGTESHIDVDSSKLTEISTQLVNAQQNLYDSRNRLKQMHDAIATHNLDAVPDILNNELLKTLKTDLSRAEGAFAETAARYDHNHPQYLSAQATVNSLRSKLANEVGIVRKSIEETAQLSQRQVDELQRALDRQKVTLLDAKHQHDELDVLNSELTSAQTAFDAGLQRASQVRMTSELNQSTIAILNSAVAPFTPSRPKVLLYMLLAFVLGSLLAAGVSFALEIRDRRVRSGRDIVAVLDIPLLGEVPRLSLNLRHA